MKMKKLQRVTERNVVHTIKRKKVNWLVIYCSETAFQSTLLKEREGEG